MRVTTRFSYLLLNLGLVVCVGACGDKSPTSAADVVGADVGADVGAEAESGAKTNSPKKSKARSPSGGVSSGGGSTVGAPPVVPIVPSPFEDILPPSWVAGAWASGDCAQTGFRYQTRSVSCLNSSGRQASETQCQGVMPSRYQVIADGACVQARSYWTYTAWENAECDGPILRQQYRRSSCTVVNNADCSYDSLGPTGQKVIDPSCNSFAGGTGTPTDPFLISTPAQFAQIRTASTYFYRLANDLNLAGEPVVDGANLPMLESITGFDGAGFAIRGLRVDRGLGLGLPIPTTDIYHNCIGGLFGSAKSVVNLRLEQAMIRFENNMVNNRFAYVGSIAGCSGNLKNIRTSGSLEVISSVPVSTLNIKVGGIGGMVDCEDCVSRTNVRVTMNGARGVSGGHGFQAYVGGVAGYSTTLAKCASLGDVVATSSDLDGPVVLNVGGLVAGVASISDSYSRGLVSARAERTAFIEVGGLAARGEMAKTRNLYTAARVVAEVSDISDRTLIWRAPTFTDWATKTPANGIYWDQAAVGLSAFERSTYFYAVNGTEVLPQMIMGTRSLGASEMSNPASFAGWDFQNVWRMGPGGYPVLRGQD